jgi:MoaA/NifB/PqqE/SkfB family radical SAM enzyme
MLIAITDWCPHHCKYCYNRSGVGERKTRFIDLDKLNVILNEMRDTFRMRFAVITGGEPFPYVLELAKRRRDFTFFTYTSGNIEPWMCREMVKLGNVVPALTIIDTNPEVHDSIRGRGNFSEVMQARRYLQEHRLPWGWSLTSSQINYEQIVSGKLLEELAALEPFLIRAMPWMPVGRADQDLVLSLEQMREVGKKIREAQQRGIRVFDYITAPVGYPCLAGGRRSFFLAPGENDFTLRVSPCVFMEDEISVSIYFREDGSSTLIDILRFDPWFANARMLAGQHQCIIHENRSNWIELIKQTGRAAA